MLGTYGTELAPYEFSVQYNYGREITSLSRLVGNITCTCQPPCISRLYVTLLGLPQQIRGRRLISTWKCDGLCNDNHSHLLHVIHVLKVRVTGAHVGWTPPRLCLGNVQSEGRGSIENVTFPVPMRMIQLCCSLSLAISALLISAAVTKKHIITEKCVRNRVEA